MSNSLHLLRRFSKRRILSTISAVLPVATLALLAVPAMAQSSPSNFGAPGDIRVIGDFDGDGEIDYAVWRPSNGNWYVYLYACFTSPPGATCANPGSVIIQQWGLEGDIPVPGAYTGNVSSAGLPVTDYAVWRPSNGTWYILPSTGTNNNPGPATNVQWGLTGDIPIVGDFDGDGKADLTVWRPSNGTWYSMLSNNGSPTQRQTPWGIPGDVPVTGDWDGDGAQDIAVWRPSNGVWYIIPSATPGSPIYKQFGLSGDIPVPANYDLNTYGVKSAGETSFAVQRPQEGNMYFSLASQPNTTIVQAWGPPNGGPALNLITNALKLCEVGKSIYIRVPGDFDGDGQPDDAFWRPRDGTWFIRYSSGKSDLILQFGLPGDVPVPGNFLGRVGPGNHPITDIAVWRPSNGVWYVTPASPSPTTTATQWGLQGDIPTLGDFDGDGKADYAVWRPSDGTWYIIPSSAPSTPIVQQWGLNGDVPVAGDYNGDHKTDFAVWRPSEGNWYILPSTGTGGNGGAETTRQWGLKGDLPVAADVDADGTTDLVVYRPSSQSLYLNLSSGTQSQLALGVGTNQLVYSIPPNTPFLGPADREVMLNSESPFQYGSGCAAQ